MYEEKAESGRDTLMLLVEQDRLLAEQAETLRRILVGKGPDDLLAMAGEIEKGVAAISESLAARRIMIFETAVSPWSGRAHTQPFAAVFPLLNFGLLFTIDEAGSQRFGISMEAKPPR